MGSLLGGSEVSVTVALITGAGGLIGSEAATHFAGFGLDVVGVDNDMRRVFFGDDASTAWNIASLQRKLGKRFAHVNIDIRDRAAVHLVFQKYGQDIALVVHAAAQPSHDWAAREPSTDFDINAVGTLNVLDACRQHAIDAAFIFTSTNKVYGDTPNRLPLVEKDTRYEIDASHPYANGIREDMSIDASLHSLFGASKVAADILVQEYGRYFGMKTVCFRGGTLTGPHHSATELHGFLAYVMRCTMSGIPYVIYGYHGKQVRDAIHSADLIAAFGEFFKSPRSGEVYNIGGSRFSNASVLEAIYMCEEITGSPLDYTYRKSNRVGDHIWWIGDNSKFASHYPQWKQEYDVRRILEEMYEANVSRWARP